MLHASTDPILLRFITQICTCIFVSLVCSSVLFVIVVFPTSRTFSLVPFRILLLKPFLESDFDYFFSLYIIILLVFFIPPTHPCNFIVIFFDDWTINQTNPSHLLNLKCFLFKRHENIKTVTDVSLKVSTIFPCQRYIDILVLFQKKNAAMILI